MPNSLNHHLVSRANALGLLALLMVLGCTPAKPTKLGAPIEGFNHTSAAINWFMVNRNGGSNFGPYMGGRSQTCCAMLPVKWHPGLKVLVEWERDPDPQAYGAWPEPMFSDAWTERGKEHRTHYTRHSAWVEVAPYDQLGVVDVHFLPCNQIAVSAVAELPGMAGYPFNFPSKMEEPTVCPTP